MNGRACTFGDQKTSKKIKEAAPKTKTEWSCQARHAGSGVMAAVSRPLQSGKGPRVVGPNAAPLDVDQLSHIHGLAAGRPSVRMSPSGVLKPPNLYIQNPGQHQSARNIKQRDLDRAIRQCSTRDGGSEPISMDLKGVYGKSKSSDHRTQTRRFRAPASAHPWAS